MDEIAKFIIFETVDGLELMIFHLNVCKCKIMVNI